VAPVPLFIGETGYPTSPDYRAVNGLLPTLPALEAYQDYYYRSIDYATKALSLPPAAPWILSDFANGAIPRGKTAVEREYHMGLYRLDGAPKPAAISTARFFWKGLIDTSINNGFEAGFTYKGIRYPIDWLLMRPGYAHFAIDTAVAHSGKESARISESTRDPIGLPGYSIIPINDIIVPGHTYSASAWVKGANATGITRVVIAWFDEMGHYLGLTSSSLLPSGTTGWTELVAQGPAPANAAYVEVNLESGNNSGTAWFDDVSFN
jgi:hypothetical protein